MNCKKAQEKMVLMSWLPISSAITLAICIRSLHYLVTNGATDTLNSLQNGRLSQLLHNVGPICWKMEQVFKKTWTYLSQVLHTQSVSSTIGYESEENRPQ